MGSFMQVLPVKRAQYGATPGGQHTRRAARELVNNGCFNITKSGLALTFKIITNGAAKLLLNHMIGVKNRNVETPGKLPADS